ncbi:hypothetical protein A3J19_02565 [Candidatus Daviesbacteria bacterium RIFCSPLOWO2_02_FULL_41_8]|uniref:Uncharacterized protein n=3 Tax=Candidatus Daviesiibacteriota TaxID=1752718 RepID=A0A1F5NLH4_9BACT|nr:MAG: hypothetical protein A2871_03370 [Candidatus Daviesbacteria bacterium RIFCSPHIGHO2_01_FULL_41_23]OGE32443.1 MAG: hypothetical protein A3D83_02210 [Candidatus Daviesbacteria bacterium RIFCSPHIGHO2_02_FULL_41_10]OGE61963.1 MAG: hypothetical protein A2967_03185 [Candidatus Daviesbacteria bacterium RIFCSPLOWO2_01_FULL_41_32]OGE78488.1 MAG: hypothetical protein A3J19_02565 [Candidatus Daviesbacteria bacterium RIFCSPLOWO2_02_FULL_41_8]
MAKRIRKHFKNILPIKKPILKEALYTQTSNFTLNTAQLDRISFSVLRNNKRELRKIENISYEINIEGCWEWIVRYDDHGGVGSLHRHIRISLKDDSNVESTIGIKKYKDKGHELTWVCKNIQRDYLNIRTKFLRNSKIDLY